MDTIVETWVLNLSAISETFEQKSEIICSMYTRFPGISVATVLRIYRKKQGVRLECPYWNVGKMEWWFGPD